MLITDSNATSISFLCSDSNISQKSIDNCINGYKCGGKAKKSKQANKQTKQNKKITNKQTEAKQTQKKPQKTKNKSLPLQA